MISVTVLAKNSQKHLAEVLTALQKFDEVVLYDTGSTDNTLAIAARFPNITIYREPFRGFGPTHNAASAVAKHDWVLSVDSDEVASPEMVDQILGMSLTTDTVYSFPRENYFNGKFIRWCGWYPDRCVRLYHRQYTRFSDDQVHEGVLTDQMNHKKLSGPLKHYSYENISDFLEKMQRYSDLFAKQYAGKRKSSLSKALLHGFFAFFKSYVLKRGFLGGYEGFVISLYNGHTAYYKYLKLLEANQKLSCEKQLP